MTNYVVTVAISVDADSEDDAVRLVDDMCASEARSVVTLETRLVESEEGDE
jgi:hypothetical protein